MIRVICPHCQAPLNAKESLLGQTRNCPNCGLPVEIRDSAAAASTAAPAVATPAATPPTTPAPLPEAEPPAPALVVSEGLPVHHWLERLNRQNHYLICDRAKLVAAWQNNGDGWMLRTHTGMINAARNRTQIPSQGEFKLVELKLEATEGGRKLVGVTSYQLAERYALLSLERGDDAIVAKITGPSGLSREQKTVVRTAVKEQFMHEVWKDAAAVLEYLGNVDFHSPGTG
jgi:hypothetical protein